MAYTNSWNESDPDGSIVDAAQIDEEINQTKQDVRERIETVIPGWTDDNEDPKIMGPGTARVLVDTKANRPGSGDFEGQCFYANDEKNLYVWDGSAWEIVSLDPTIEVAQISEYDDSLGSGNKETDTGSFADILALFVTGTTDGSGLITIDTGELSGSWDPALIWAEEVIAAPTATSVGTIANVVYKNPGSSTFDLEFRNYNGNLETNASVSCIVWLPQL